VSRQTKHRQGRRKKGLCAREGCPEVCSTYYCASHAKARDKYRKRNKQNTHQADVAA
jgi:hypothetical protein